MEIGSTENEDELPDYVDAELSFEIEGYPGRNFLIGNPHTFPGRMEAYSEAERRSFSVSFHELTNVSPAARAWISGFLSGSEPEPPAFTGDQHAEAVEVAWRAVVGQYGGNGHLPAVSDQWKLAARDRINTAATRVVSQADFVSFLRILDALVREGSGTWTPVPGEYFFDAWAAALDTSGDPNMYGLSPASAIEADWQELALSVLRGVFDD